MYACDNNMLIIKSCVQVHFLCRLCSFWIWFNMDAGSGWHVLAPEKWQVKRMHAPLLHMSVIAHDGLVHLSGMQSRGLRDLPMSMPTPSFSSGQNMMSSSASPTMVCNHQSPNGGCVSQVPTVFGNAGLPNVNCDNFAQHHNCLHAMLQL